METLPELDALIASAWPPATVEHFDGWTFRYTSGITRRANSVLALNEPTDLSAAVAAAEAFYDRHGLPPTFMFSQASSPTALKAFLVDRGYAETSTTCVLWAHVDVAQAALSTNYAGQLHASGRPGDDWFNTYWDVDAKSRFPASARQTVRDVLLAPKPPAVFVSAVHNGRVESVGQVVIESGWGCIQSLATPDWARRRGAATGVLQQLIGRVDDAGADRIFACVIADNEASLRLFEQAGFQLSHQYSYYQPGVWADLSQGAP